MTMEVDVDPSTADEAEPIDETKIVDFLTNIDEICFKSQQRGESDLTKQEKTNIATEIYDKSKLTFLTRFGKYLHKEQLNFFQQFTQNSPESDEISIVLKDLLSSAKSQTSVKKNRRFQALKRMIEENSYFSEVEMMKRDPLLYDQLVGQFLSEAERAERDKIEVENTTLVKVLMEGIERDDAKIKQAQQEEYEDEVMEEQEDEEDSDSDNYPDTQEPVYAQWGGFSEDERAKKIKRKRTKQITEQEQSLLRQEFVSTMYQHFLDGKDEDFDYETVDNNDQYDNTDLKEYDEEDKYFDSEEPQLVKDQTEVDVTEDELDVFMSALNQNPSVSQLSEDIQKL